MKTKNIFITGIDTEIGKTIVSATVTEALKANYWKPIQSGLEEQTDSEIVQNLAPSGEVLQEAWRLNTPASPHASAEIDGVFIDQASLKLPQTNREHLVIEGAGGLLVPLNNKGLLLADMIPHWNAAVIVVIKNYLGSINHSLLTCEYLKSKNVPVLGIILNGEENPQSESFILQHSQFPLLGRIQREQEINANTIADYAATLKPNLIDALNKT